MIFNKMIIFLSIVFIIFILMDLLVLTKWKKFCIRKNYSKKVFQIPIYFSFIAGILFTYVMYFNFFIYPTPLYVKILNILVSFWYLPKLLIVPFILITEFLKMLKSWTSKKIKLKENEETIEKSRRKFVGNVAWSIAGIPYLMAFKGLTFTVNDLKIFKETIYFENLMPGLDGLRIVQISDLHLGTFLSQEPLVKLMNIINKLSPDLIFITGDFVNFRQEELDNGHKLLTGLRAKYGVYGCLGNHDHYMSDEDHAKLIKRLKTTEIELLINEHKVLEINNTKLNIVGIDNLGTKQKFGDYDIAYKGVPQENFTILLAHDPKSWESHVVEKRKADLTLSGHTHGGQVAIEFLGYDLSIAKAIYKHYKGLYNAGSQYLYVNRGIGVSGPPIRLGINPEITLITLKQPKNYV